MESTFLTTDHLQAGLEHVLQSPKESGSLESIEGVCRGAGDPHECAHARSRGRRRSRAVQSGGRSVIVDLDLSEDNLPAGQPLQIDDVILEVSEVPHTGCKKFVDRFGTDAASFINAPDRGHLHLRGINARVVHSGTVNVGAEVRKV